jgi:chemotaxis protein CheD
MIKPALAIKHCHPDLDTWAQVYLKQGEHYISNGQPAQVKTVLGSCVSVTMHCPILKIGGITHSLLPFPIPGTTLQPGHRGRFVISSINLLFERLLSNGAVRNSLEVKIFGGGQMFLPDPDRPVLKSLNIGRRNVETALETIQKHGLSVTTTDVGGNLGRKLLFFPHNGDVWVKKINRLVHHQQSAECPNALFRGLQGTG